MERPIRLVIFCILNITWILPVLSQNEIDFRIVPGKVCASIIPDNHYLFEESVNIIRIEAGPETILLDTTIAGADYLFKKGFIEIIPYPSNKEVALSIQAKYGEHGNITIIERKYAVFPKPYITVGRTACDSVIDAYTFLLNGGLRAYSKEAKTNFAVDSFTIDWVTETQLKSKRMKENAFPKEFRADMLKERPDQPVFFTEIYGSQIKGIPISLKACQFFITETQTPTQWSVGDDED